MTRITDLASFIQANINIVDEYFKSHGLPTPSFDVDGPVDFNIQSAEVERARVAALEASIELQDLLQSPRLCLRPVLNGTSLQAIWKYDLAAKVPIHGKISYEDLAGMCDDLSESDLRRILRFAMTHHRVFQEPNKGYVGHSAASRLIVEDSNARDAVGYQYDEVWQSFARTIEAKEKFKSGEPTASGWSLAQNTDRPMWEYYGIHPEKGKRFTGAMAAFTKGSGNEPSYLIQSYPWPSVGNGSGTVVDVGGGKGHVSIAIAQAVPGLQFVVQELPEVIADARAIALPAEVSDRIEFMEHDFFTEQPVVADVYLFRYIFHNWSDTHVVKILKSLVPALRRGARVVVNDILMPEPNTMSLTKEREIRAMDMIMLTLFNSREREKDDWIRVFREADERFKDVKMWIPEGAAYGIIEAVWHGDP